MLVESYILPFSDKVRVQYNDQDNRLLASFLNMYFIHLIKIHLYINSFLAGYGRNEIYCACWFPQKAHKLVETSSAKQTTVII